MPGVISLLAGKPNAATFPFTALSFTARAPRAGGAETTLSLDPAALAEGLQYGDTAGMSELLDWLYTLQERNHGRVRSADWHISVGAGSQDLIYKVGGPRACCRLLLTRVRVGSHGVGEPGRLSAC